MIQHLVVVRLRHARGSVEETTFLRGCEMLAGIPGVQRFEIMKQTSAAAGYDFAFSMWFDDEEAYAAYRVHPDHIRYGEEIWAPAVAEGKDLDFVRL